MSIESSALRAHDATHEDVAESVDVNEDSAGLVASWDAPRSFMVRVLELTAREGEDAGQVCAYSDLRAGATPNRFLPLDYAEPCVAHLVDNEAHECGTFDALTSVQRAALVIAFMDAFGTAYLAEFELAERAS